MICRIRGFFFALLSAGCIASATAGESPSSLWSGRVYFDAYAPAKDPLVSDFRELMSSVWLTGTPKLSDSTAATFTIQADLRGTGQPGQTSQASFTLRDAYTTWTRGSFEARFGRQIVPWGKSDAVNPTDFLSAKDFGVFNPDEEFRRKGTEMVHLQWTPSQGNSPWVFTGVYAPRPARSSFLIAPSVLPAGVTLASGSRVPTVGLDDGEFAFKAAFQQSAWDAELIAFRGWNHFPDLVLDGTTLAQEHHRISALGTNVSASSGSWVFRFESAWIWTENPDGRNLLVAPTRWDTVAGVERGFGETFRVQVQMVSRFHPHFFKVDEVFPSPLDPRRALARANALIHAYQFKTRIGATLRAAYTLPASGFEAELFLLGNFMGGDSLVRPKVSYPVSDSLRLTAGLDWYSGPEDRPLGALQAFNSVFAEARASF
jgi:hypothetical protein